MFNAIIYRLYQLPGIEPAGRAESEDIIKAENELGISFPDEYIEYLREFGCVTFFGGALSKWTGVGGSDPDCDVIEVTKKARVAHPTFPRDCFVLECREREGFIIVNPDGQVFLFREKEYVNPLPICQTLSDYVTVFSHRILV